jgi:hypothetical protein
MFIAYQNLIKGNLDEIDNNKLFILRRWASFEPSNTNVCSLLDRWSLKANPEIIKYLMANMLSKKIPKYLKADVKDKFIIDAYKKHYGFSQHEYELQKHLINIPLKQLAVEQGWNKKECLEHGVEWIEPKKQKLKIEVKKSKGLMDF